MNEGISYPVDDQNHWPDGTRGIRRAWHLHGFSGEPLMDKSGQMAIIESPDDMRIRIARRNSLLCVEPLWEDQKGQFGYDRKLRYVFF